MSDSDDVISLMPGRTWEDDINMDLTERQFVRLGCEWNWLCILSAGGYCTGAADLLLNAVKCVGQGKRMFHDTAPLEMNPLMIVEKIFFLEHF
jgi:hypothetical protein